MRNPVPYVVLSAAPRALAWLFVIIFTFSARGQVCGGWQADIGRLGVSGEVSAVVRLADGDLLIGGTFSAMGGVPANGLARFRPSTSTWSSVGMSDFPQSWISALALLSDGTVIVGGSFFSAGGVAVQNIARYNPTTNAWSALGPGVNLPVLALAVLSNGDVVIAGHFLVAGGTPANRTARWSPATGVWSPLGSGTSNSVNALAILPNDIVVAGGSFQSVGGVAASNIAQYNPTTNGNL